MEIMRAAEAAGRDVDEAVMGALAAPAAPPARPALPAPRSSEEVARA